MLIYTCKAERDTLTEGGEEMQEMTTAELNQYLENIAKLIEATAENAEAAAKIVRESKVKAEKRNRLTTTNHKPVSNHKG